MSCAEAIELISALLDGELTVPDIVRLRHHVDGCESCRAAQASEIWLFAFLAAEALAEEPPASLRQRIQQGIAAETAAASRQRVRRWRRVLLPAVIASALGIGGVVAFFVGTAMRKPAESPIFASALGDHRRYALAVTPRLEVATADAARLEQWIRERLGLDVRLPAGAGHGEPLAGARVATLAGDPAAQVLYARGARRVSLFVSRRPAARLPEDTEHVIEGMEVYTTSLDTGHLGWWQDQQHLYVAVSTGSQEDLMFLAGLCVRSQRMLPATRLARRERGRIRKSSRIDEAGPRPRGGIYEGVCSHLA